MSHRVEDAKRRVRCDTCAMRRVSNAPKRRVRCGTCRKRQNAAGESARVENPTSSPAGGITRPAGTVRGRVIPHHIYI